MEKTRYFAVTCDIGLLASKWHGWYA